MTNHSLQVSVRNWEWYYSNMSQPTLYLYILKQDCVIVQSKESRPYKNTDTLQKRAVSYRLCSTQGYVKQHNNIGRVKEEAARTKKSHTLEWDTSTER